MSWGGGGSSVVTDFGAPHLFRPKADLPWGACSGCGFHCLHTTYMRIAPVQYTSLGVEIAAWGEEGAAQAGGWVRCQDPRYLQSIPTPSSGGRGGLCFRIPRRYYHSQSLRLQAIPMFTVETAQGCCCCGRIIHKPKKKSMLRN